jgi:hypothetical protein
VNHTRNIQGKDFERLPYPFWVSAQQKRTIVADVKRLVDAAAAGRRVIREDQDFGRIGAAFNGFSG